MYAIELETMVSSIAMSWNALVDAAFEKKMSQSDV